MMNLKSSVFDVAASGAAFFSLAIYPESYRFKI